MEKEYLSRFGWFLEPRNWWARHLAFWIYRYSEFLFSWLGMIDDLGYGLWEFVRAHLLPDLFLVYLNLFVLIPMLLLRKKVWQFAFAGLLLILAYSALNFGLNPPDFEAIQMSPFTAFFQLDFLDGVQVFLLTTGLRVMLEYLYNTIRFREMQNTNLKTELAYLKSQVNPHFLFNTLNNITVLSETRPERVTPTVIQLSNVLRYQLYEGEKEQVLLHHEIENLRNYLNLEALRLNRPDFKIDVDGNLAQIAVAPLIFLPFVENALKHGVNNRGEISLEMRFKMEGNMLVFFIENSRPKTAATQLNGGIGLKNIQRRLELLYPKRHELKIEDLEDRYRVWLRLMV